MSEERRLVGIDLGIASEHTVRVLSGDGREVCRRRCSPTVASLEAIEKAALDTAPTGTRLEVVMEPTGPAWLPVAVFFDRRGHAVYRVSSAKASDLRKFLSRHAKSNGIDANTLARMPLVDPTGLVPLELPDRDRAELDRHVRATDRLTQLASEHKVRIRALVRQLLPMTPLRSDFSKSDAAVLEVTGGDPHQVLDLGPDGLTTLILDASIRHLGRERAQDWVDSAEAALALYGDHAAFPAAALADEVRTEVRLLAATEEELARHAALREQAYQRVDPHELARSLPGIATVSAPALVAIMGRPQRFRTAAHFRSYTGLAPKASETGDTDRKGQPMSKAGPGLLRTTLIRAADSARKQDPQLARLYWQQMVERGANHIKALCVVAAHLGERAWRVMQRGEPYVVRDVDGRVVSHLEAMAIISERWTVPEQARRRRRSQKKGKAPQQVLKGHVQGGVADAATRRPSPSSMVPVQAAVFKPVAPAVVTVA
jgi:transposase